MKKVGKSRVIGRFLSFFLYAFSGFLTALPLVFGKGWIFAWLAPVPILYREFFIVDDGRHRYLRAWTRGLLYFWCYGFVAFSWFAGIYPIDYLGYGKWDAIIVIIMAMVLLPLIQAVCSAFVFVYIAAIKKTVFFTKHTVLSFFGTAFLWSVAEWCQTLTFLGVPWGRFAVGQAENRAIIQSISLFGPYFIAFIIVLTACFVANAACSLLLRKGRRALISIALAVLIFTANYGFGAVRIITANYDGADSVTVAALQGNILFEDKFYGKEDYILNTYRQLTASAAEDGAELILWPETAIPYDINSDEKYSQYLVELQEQTDTVIVASFFRQDGDKLYNSVCPVTEEGIGGQFYSKRHLVPFGEYVPLESFISAVCPPLARFAAIDYPLSAGDDPCVFQLPLGKISSLVCFDSIFEELCREGVCDGAQLICISTNDSWFSRSEALRQHNLQAVLRCVESGRFGVRAANTGISSVISPTGEIIASLGDGEQGYITGDVRMISDLTLYDKIGNIIVTVGIVFVLSTLVWASFRKKQNGNSN